MKNEFETKKLWFDKFITASVNLHQSLFYKITTSSLVYQNIGFTLKVAKQQGVSSVKRNVNSRVSYIDIFRCLGEMLFKIMGGQLKARLFQKKKKTEKNKQIVLNREAKFTFVPVDFMKIIKKMQKNNDKIKTFHFMVFSIPWRFTKVNWKIQSFVYWSV